MNYTKGEWKIHKDEHNATWVVTDTSKVCVLLDGANARVKANAQLIASAPDLYEALKAVVERYEIILIGDDQKCDVMAIEALAKADGK